jgi:hypothetical protein
VNDWVADWDDVLRRAGRSRYHAWGAAAAAAALAVSIALLMPGIGIGGGLTALISGSSRPGLELRADLAQGGRAIGSLSIHTSRVIVGVVPQTGRVKSVPVAQPEFRWLLEVSPGVKVSSLRIVRSGRVALRLCGPCGGATTGIFRGSPTAFGAIFGRGTVVAVTDHGSARGTLRLEKPRR